MVLFCSLNKLYFPNEKVRQQYKPKQLKYPNYPRYFSCQFTYYLSYYNEILGMLFVFIEINIFTAQNHTRREKKTKLKTS